MPLLSKNANFLFLRSFPHSPALGLVSWNSEWKWDP